MAIGRKIAVALTLFGLAYGYLTTPITGHDFDFKAVYPSGLEISTKSPPKDILPPEEIPRRHPVLTLIDPDETARRARYIAFLAIIRIPTIDILDDEIYTFPWAYSNLTVLANGTLSNQLRESISYYHVDTIEGGEVRNVTMHVWMQTPQLMEWLDAQLAQAVAFPLFWNLATVWRNITSKVSMDFPRANVDFKVQNKTGYYRCDIDGNGAPISGISIGATTCVSSSPTKAASDTAHSTIESTPTTGVFPAGNGSSSSAPNAATGLQIAAVSSVGMTCLVLTLFTNFMFFY